MDLVLTNNRNKLQTSRFATLAMTANGTVTGITTVTNIAVVTNIVVLSLLSLICKLLQVNRIRSPGVVHINLNPRFVKVHSLIG